MMNATVLPQTDEPKQADQLSLPTRPVLLQGGKGDRTPEGKAWERAVLSQALQHLPTKPSLADRTDKAVIRYVAFLGSCNTARACFASIGGLADYLEMGRSTVTRSLNRWESRGVFEVAKRKGGRVSQRNRGRFNWLVLQPSHGDSANQVTETRGTKRSKNLDLPIPVSPVGKVLTPDCKGIKASEKQPALIESTKAKAKGGGRVVRMWFGIQRRLGGFGEQYLQGQAAVFKALPHGQKVKAINQLLSEENRAVESGSLEAFGGRQ